MPEIEKPAGELVAPGVPEVPRPSRPRQAAGTAFPVIGVGASAGGLEAVRQLLAQIPPDAGLAIVLVQHLEATRASLLSEAISQATTMKVAEAEHGVRLEPNHVYVIPPGTQMSIDRGTLTVAPIEASERRPHLPIDNFFQSLADDRGRQAIGVILSGTASDGTAGLAAIRANGGITLVQDPQTARFPQMPQSAVDAGVVDFCLPPQGLGAELARLASHPYLVRSEPVPPTPAGAAFLAEVSTLLRTTTGIDFGEYKPATLIRRLARRMAVRKVQGLAGYLEMLRQEPAEVRALFEDLLIKVTSFFRDPACFDELKATAFPEIVKLKPPGAPIRAWVVGCATGEEVYSLAIALLEHFGASRPIHPLLIFGSDISERAIATARAGFYTDAAVQALGEERLGRYFVRAERGWRVSQAVRELCVFVRHDVGRDPPFSRLDLVSCRNVLIYFGHALQRRVLAAAHYSLNQPGYLLLGRAESAAAVPRWFSPTSPDGRLFLRRSGPSTFRFTPRSGALPSGAIPAGAGPVAPPRVDGALTHHVDDLLLARYAPPGVILNERLEVLQFRGRTGAYLEPPQGAPQSQVLKMARPGLVSPLRLALARAIKTSAPVRKERVDVGGAGAERWCDLVVLPLSVTEGGERTYAVLFEERPGARAGPGTARTRGGASRPDDGSRRELEEELASMRENVASLLEEQTRSHDVLSAGNDDLVSSNEELQSLNEELETAKEEVQASNEELVTLNDELHERNQELQRVGADVLNLLDAVEIPILMFDAEHRLRRFTRRAAAFLGLAPADLGRQLGQLVLPLRAPDLESWITRAETEGVLVEAEVQDGSERWHRLQIRPRRVAGDRVEGIILSLVDIHALRSEVALATWARDYSRGIVEAVQVPLVTLDAGFHVLSANAAYYRHFREKPADTEGMGFFQLGAGEWDTPELRQAVAATGREKRRFQGLLLERRFPGPGRRSTSISGCAAATPSGDGLILLAIEDITERRQDEQRRAELLEFTEAARRAAERSDQAKDLFVANLSHELRTPLTTILIHAQSLSRYRLDAAEAAQAGASIEVEARRQVALVEDLLDLTGMGAGKVNLSLEPVDWSALVLGGVEAASAAAGAKALDLSTSCQGATSRCLGDPRRLKQVVANLLGNAIKFTPSGGRIEVRIDAVDGFARLQVADTGRGIAPAFLPHVFERFAQEAGAALQAPGLGLGLAIVHELVRLHGGSVLAESAGRDQGSTFTVLLPRQPAPEQAGHGEISSN